MKKNSPKEKVELGSATARAGFANEKIVRDKFNDWKSDKDSQEWLTVMGYNLAEIKEVVAVKITGSYKTDVQVKVTIILKDAIDAQNLSIKLVSNPTGFNQIDKRWIDKYIGLWHIPHDVSRLLKLFTGESAPTSKDCRDKRRMFIDEFSKLEQDKIIKFFEDNKILVITDILKGRDHFSVDWMLVALKNTESGKVWALKSINEVMNHFGRGSVQISPRGSLKIGRITMQRKGGDGGRPSAEMLQFKINPAEILNL